MIGLLLDKGANIEHGRYTTVCLLVDRGAGFHIMDKMRRTALYLAAVIFLDWSQSEAPDWIRFYIRFGAVDCEAGLEWI